MKTSINLRVMSHLLLGLVLLVIWNNRAFADNFSRNFLMENRILLEESEKDDIWLALIQDIDIDSHSNIWLIDWKRHNLIKYSPDGKKPEKVGRNGRGPGELFLPQSLYINRKDHIFVANFGNRITEYDSTGKPINAFITSGGHFPTSCIIVNGEGTIIVGGPKLKPGKNSLTGEMLHLYKCDGSFIKSFCNIDEKLGPMNLGRYKSVFFDIDQENNIYTVQPMNFKVEVYDKEGNYLRSFGKKQDYYKEPKPLPQDVERDKNKMMKFRGNITYVKDVFTSEDNVAVVSRNQERDNPYIFIYYIDLYNIKSGELIVGGIKTNRLLFRVRDNKFYFYQEEYTNDGNDENHIIEICRRTI